MRRILLARCLISVKVDAPARLSGSGAVPRGAPPLAPTAPPPALRANGPPGQPTMAPPLGAAAGRHRLGPAGLEPAIEYLTRSPADRRRRVPLLSRADARRPAGRRRLGDRAPADRHPQRHPSRCALSLPLDHEPRRAGDHDRRGAARVVLQPGVKLDFRHFADGYVATAADVAAELQRIGHALQPLDIVVVNTAAGAPTAGPITSPAAAAWAARRRSTCWSAACGHRHRRLELGCALRPHQGALRRRPAMPA